MLKPQIKKFKYPSAKEEMPPGPCVTAGILVENNAGWRTFKPVLDSTRCVKCQTCWLICPDGVIDRTGDVYEIDYNFCKGCGLCAAECPLRAIKMVKEGEVK